jgi:hypothetical protein
MGNAEFPETTFKGNARFFDATFDGDARFVKATFSDRATFDDAKFGGNVSFDAAIFNGESSSSFRRSRVLSLDAEHIWPTGWRLEPQSGSDETDEYTVVRANEDNRSQPAGLATGGLAP